MRHQEKSGSFKAEKDPLGGGDATAACTCGWSVTAGTSADFEAVTAYVREELHQHVQQRNPREDER